MQMTFDFGGGAELAAARDRLREHFGALPPPPRRTPMGQLVKSLISNRTYDRVSLAAYEALRGAFADWATMTAAPTAALEAVIAEVQFADRKAGHLPATLRQVAAERPDFDLTFLGELRPQMAFAWLERLPGVGRKVAASVLNFSTLQRPALVIDSHLTRVLQRLGVGARRADTVALYDAAMNAAADWPAVDLTDLHVWMKRLGQTCCRPRSPGCCDCPLQPNCVAATREPG